MKAVVWHGPYDVRVETVSDPAIREPQDAIVRVTAASICGTDLHPYHGLVPPFQPGTVMGHEFVGVVEALGSGVQRIKVGDRVVASDVVACGQCWYCRRGWHWQCIHKTLFGYGPVLGEDVPGGQAEYVRVPYADTVLLPLPDTITDEQALFLGDILPTGYAGARNGGIHVGDTVAVVGCGPVGAMAQMVAQLFGPAHIVALDRVPERLAIAERLGSTPLNIDQVDAATVVRELTDGRGADVVIECVGGEPALHLATTLVRPHGTISVVGFHGEEAFPWPGGWAFAHEITLRYGAGDMITDGETLLALIQAGRLDPSTVITHRFSLDEAPEAYRLFDQKHAFKVVLQP